MTPAYPNCISVPFPVELLYSKEASDRERERVNEHFRQRDEDIARGRLERAMEVISDGSD